MELYHPIRGWQIMLRTLITWLLGLAIFKWQWEFCGGGGVRERGNCHMQSVPFTHAMQKLGLLHVCDLFISNDLDLWHKLWCQINPKIYILKKSTSGMHSIWGFYVGWMRATFTCDDSRFFLRFCRWEGIIIYKHIYHPPNIKTQLPINVWPIHLKWLGICRTSCNVKSL